MPNGPNEDHRAADYARQDDPPDQRLPGCKLFQDCFSNTINANIPNESIQGLRVFSATRQKG